MSDPRDRSSPLGSRACGDDAVLESRPSTAPRASASSASSRATTSDRAGNSFSTRAYFAATRTPRYLLPACSAISHRGEHSHGLDGLVEEYPSNLTLERARSAAATRSSRCGSRRMAHGFRVDDRRDLRVRVLEVVVHDHVLVRSDLPQLLARRPQRAESCPSDLRSAAPAAVRCRTSVDGGSRNTSTDSGNARANCRAPCTSMSMITCLPDASTRSTSCRSVPYRLPCTSADSANSLPCRAWPRTRRD